MAKRARPGGERGLNGEWYAGGQFLPSSERTIKGRHRRRDAARSGVRRWLVEPGVRKDLPEGWRAVYQGIQEYVEPVDEGKDELRPKRWMVERQDFPWERHFDGGVEELVEWIGLYNLGLRSFRMEEGRNPLECAKEALVAEMEAHQFDCPLLS